jgi:enamine deaminase RidA (YjgF/YER057c/UK114 family)
VSSGSPYEQSVGFSRGVRTGCHVAVAGTAPVWPDGTVDRDPLTQARRCWEIALGALAELGGTAADVVRTRTYLTGREYEEAASIAHGEHFSEVRPASTMIVVAGLLDPRWLLEVELDAILDEAGADPSEAAVRTEAQP